MLLVVSPNGAFFWVDTLPFAGSCCSRLDNIIMNIIQGGGGFDGTLCKDFMAQEFYVFHTGLIEVEADRIKTDPSSKRPKFVFVRWFRIMETFFFDTELPIDSHYHTI